MIKHLSIQPQIIDIIQEPYRLIARLYQKCLESHLCPGVLFVPGWDPGNFEETAFDAVAEYCADQAECVALVLTYRGQGSEGDIKTLTRADFLTDILAGYDYLAGLPGVDPQKIDVVGESFGGHMASILSSKRPVARLVLRAPSDFPSDGYDDQPHILKAGGATYAWKSLPHSPQESLALEAVSRYAGELLIVASEQDSVIPRQTTQNYADAAAGSQKVRFCSIEAGHALLHRREIEAFQDVLVRFLFKEQTRG